MSTTIKTGWLNDKEGNKFAPKTLTSQVQTSDGTLLEDKIQADLDATKTEILENVAFGGVAITIDSELSSTSTNPVQNKIINAELVKKLDATTADSNYETKTNSQAKLDEAKSHTQDCISTHDTSTSAHSDIREKLQGTELVENKIETITDDATNVQYPSALAVKTYVDSLIGVILNGAS